MHSIILKREILHCQIAIIETERKKYFNTIPEGRGVWAVKKSK